MKPSTWFGPSEARDAGEPLVSLADVTEIELRVLKRMREFTIGEHSSVFQGSGFDFTGLRDWQAGDRFEHIDWPQSSLTGFSPFVVRDFEQPSTSGVVVVADRSGSTRGGFGATSIEAIVARAIATIGMSAVFFQDSIGIIAFEERFERLAGLRPRIGKNQVIRCLDFYQGGTSARGTSHEESAPLHRAPPIRQGGTLSATLGGFMHRTSLVPVISDFLFDRPDEVLRELARLDTQHDVFITLVDAAFAFELPGVSAGWLEAYDVETGRACVMSRGHARRLAGRVREWQDEVVRLSREAGLDVLRLGADRAESDAALSEFVIHRRLRKGK